MRFGRRFFALSMASVLAAFCASTQAEARALNFDTEKFGTYIRGTFGPSSLGDSAFANSSGTSTSTDRKVRSNFSGEFGVLFPMKKFNIRLSAEYLYPYHYSDIKGTDSSGNSIFTLDSKVAALIPLINIEYLLWRKPASHILLGIGGGPAFVTLDNEYKMDSSQTTYPTISDHKESATATAVDVQAYSGFEFLFTDTATLALDIGWRFLYVGSLKSSKDTDTFTGHESSDDDLKNSDGSNRTLNLGGAFVGLSLRFYIGS